MTERFTYLGSDIHVSADSEPEVNIRLGRAWGVMDSLDNGGVALPVPVREDESPSLQVLGAFSLALWMRDLDSDQGSEDSDFRPPAQVPAALPPHYPVNP